MYEFTIQVDQRVSVIEWNMSYQLENLFFIKLYARKTSNVYISLFSSQNVIFVNRSMWVQHLWMQLKNTQGVLFFKTFFKKI